MRSDRPEWESIYAEEGTPWDLGAPCPVLEELLAEASRHGLREGARIAVPGCGLGHDAAWLAARGFRATGLDLVPEALVRARAAYGEGAAWQQGDWLGDDLGTFDAILDHTFFVAFDPARRAEVVEAHARHLCPGGLWLGVFFHRVKEEGIRPWAVQPSEVRALAAPGFDVLALEPAAGSHPRRLGREFWMVARRR